MPFHWKNGNHNTKGELRQWVQQYQTMGGGGLPVIVGLVDERNVPFVRDGVDFIYGDHSYFDRGWDKFHFRLCRNGHHQTKVYPRPDDRLKRWKVNIEPWRTDGLEIVVIPPSQYYLAIYSLHTWLADTLKTLREHTDRPIHVKTGKGRLRECITQEHPAHAVVCAISVAGMEAGLMGIPVFSTKHCCSWPINAGPLEKIETPERPERHAWACSLAYAAWHADELETIDWRKYEYSVREEMCAV